ncbi:MAG: thioredoxin [Myxococcales bacterium]|nr:thioredoxin [Myxococcales bacterium]
MPLPIVNESEFETKVLRNELPVLVDFFATWCAPCKQMDPELDALSHELRGKAEFVKVDIDKSQRLATMMRVESVPTYVAFSRGRPVGVERGVISRARLRALIEPHLPRAEGAIRPQELLPLLNKGAVVAIDTREAVSFNRARLPGARHIPLEEIATRLAELHMHGTPVLYCRSGDKTKELCDKLATDGIDLPFLEGGLLAWEAAFLPIDKP